jgi:hypothetical protein
MAFSDINRSIKYIVKIKSGIALYYIEFFLNAK